MTDERSEAPDVATRLRTLINEDWAATILGILLLVLVLAKAITKELVPGIFP